MAECVMDASAIMAILFNERGSDAALRHAGDAAVSAVTIAEVATKLNERGQDASYNKKILSPFQFDIHPFDSDEAFACAALRSSTRAKGLSLGDRACLALAKRLGLPAVTADRAWSDVADAAGVTVLQIR